ncbi:MAG: hypothetical protein KGI70_02975 [Patescibacteria group bacterium]|nr:hypothetical protein [Patescibacteria group bacterium]
MHPHVWGPDDSLARISMRIHLVERPGWTGPRPTYINYALGHQGMVVQFEVHRFGHEYACHFKLSDLLQQHFAGVCPLLLVEFAHGIGVDAGWLLHEALTHK